MRTWMAKGKLDELARLWVRGLNVDWSAMYGTQRPRRVALPTYPFARERHWLPRSATAPTVHVISPTMSLSDQPDINGAKPVPMINNAGGQMLQPVGLGHLTDAALHAATIVQLKAMVGRALDMRPHEIDSRKTLDHYGIDSLVVVNLTQELQAFIPNFDGAILFESQSIALLADSLVAIHCEALREWFVSDVAFSTLAITEPSTPLPSTPTLAERSCSTVTSAAQRITSPAVAPIAEDSARDGQRRGI